MAYCGPWGVYVAIPRCGSTWMRKTLIEKMGKGVEVGPHHGLPNTYDGVRWFTTIRPPHKWYRSLWAYMVKHEWQVANSESPLWNMVTSQVAPHTTPDFNLFIEKIHNAWYYGSYGLCAWVYTSMMPPGEGWYKLDFVDQFFKIELGINNVNTTPVNASEDLPEIKLHARELIEDMESRIYEDFNFKRWG